VTALLRSQKRHIRPFEPNSDARSLRVSHASPMAPVPLCPTLCHVCTPEDHARPALHHARSPSDSRFFERYCVLCYDPTAGPARSESADAAVTAPTTDRCHRLLPLSRTRERGPGGEGGRGP
jgi:hypothetical protein